jgi:integrase/recombinase XerC
MSNNLRAFQDYLQLEKNYSHHTINAYIKDIAFFQNFILKEFDQEEITTVNYSQVRSWIVEMVEQSLSNNSINRKIASLKAFYKFLLKTKQIDVSPLLKHKSLKTPKKIQIPFSEKELDNVLDILKYENDFEGIRNKLIISHNE